jgi:hypothetical protein
MLAINPAYKRLPWYDRLRGAFWIELSGLLPRQLVFAAGLRLGAHATCGRYRHERAEDLTLFTVLNRWNEGNADAVVEENQT